MNRMGHADLEDALRRWAAEETARQTTPLTPAMLRIRQHLALREARRRRQRRLLGGLLLPPALGAVLLAGASGCELGERLLALNPGALMAACGGLLLLACLGQAWSEA